MLNTMKRAVICFTRVPKPGQTKTRLLPILSPEQCCALHTAFLKDLAALYEHFPADLFVAYTNDPDWPQLKEIFSMSKGFFPQEGEDLGAKMLHAMETVLKQGYEACVLTGSDLPLLSVEQLESGFSALECADVTLGPTSDGGYYLVGSKLPHPELFSNQQYGDTTVWENTLSAAKQAGYSVCPALPCDDVDTPDDLRALWKTIAHNGSHTARFLESIQKEGVSLC